MKPTRTARRKDLKASTLLLALILIAVLSIVAGHVLLSVLGGLQTRAQSSSWQESILAAEAGVDLAMGELTRNSRDVIGANWEKGGWKKLAPRAPGSSGAPGSPASGQMLKPKQVLPGSSLAVSETIVLDNIRLNLDDLTPAEVDVQLTALWPNPGTDPENPNPPVWFKIRSLGTTLIPGNQSPADSMDAKLRRVNLKTVRGSQSGDDNLAQTIPLPNVSRTVELLVRPVPRFGMAMCARQTLDLPNSINWTLNSYIRDTNGNELRRAAYEGKADIGLIAKSEQATLLDANWMANSVFPRVNGNIHVNGDPTIIATDLPPEGDSWHKKYTIFDDFERDLRPVDRPSGYMEEVMNPPTDPKGKPTGATTTITAGTTTNPRVVVYQGDLSSFVVEPQAGQTTGRLILIVRGDLIPKNQGTTPAVQIAGNVRVDVVVEGEVIDFANGDINTTSNADPLLLRIYGINNSDTRPEDQTGNPREILMNGNYNLNALIYAPYYNLTSKGGGNGIWRSSVVANTIDLRGGGANTFLYPEALLLDPESERYEITRYFEDLRK